jgi:hypothetical protein
MKICYNNLSILFLMIELCLSHHICLNSIDSENKNYYHLIWMMTFPLTLSAVGTTLSQSILFLQILIKITMRLCI